jgi:excisionase family DNA binding protein
MNETWHTVQEAAAVLGVGGEAVSEYCRDGVLPGAYKDGTRWRIPAAAIAEWIAGPRLWMVQRASGQRAVVSARTTGEARRLLAASCGIEGPDVWLSERVLVVRLETDSVRVVLRGC